MEQADECPFCLGPMQTEDREGRTWLVCPNGCATEVEVPPRKPPEVAVEASPAVRSARASGEL
ncbi:MAG TPA: hypothetical protein VEV17_01175 [Bryobacteraceae bacterium]|nr:hypothetical protein [Bryobacteraceae bacterium]